MLVASVILFLQGGLFGSTLAAHGENSPTDIEIAVTWKVSTNFFKNITKVARFQNSTLFLH